MYTFKSFKFFVLLLLPISATSSLAQDRSLLAKSFVVAERLVLKDSNNKDLVLHAGLLPLEFSPPRADFVLSHAHALLDPFENRGGDGEPPRGPVRIEFRNAPQHERGIMEMRFSNRRVLFWLDQRVETDRASGEPLMPQAVRASVKSSGQGLGVRLSINRQSPNLAPLTIILLENDRRPVADIELRRGGEGTDPR